MKVYVSDHVKFVRDLYRPGLEDDNGGSTLQLLERLAECLFQGFKDRQPGATVELTNWHPRFVGMPASEVFESEFSLQDARLSVAREFGWSSWESVEDAVLDSEFEDLIDLMLDGEIEDLRKAISKNGGLLTSRSKFGHRATLLHYLASNGVETYRQVVPQNVAEIAAVLIDAGSDKTAVMRVYGGEFTPLELAKTSAHPVEAGAAEKLFPVLT